MNSLITSMVHRPYVFIFLAAYLFLAIRKWGWRRAFVWLISGYTIAWMSEFSSINNGFPYGEYHYIYDNMPGELMVFGVPFFDSLSYPFLIFAGYAAAEFAVRNGRAAALKKILLGASLTTLLDAIIDPVAKLGGKWFLGQIYYYAEDGFYFGVPFSNFAGWFLVSLAVIASNAAAWGLMPGIRPRQTAHSAARDPLGIAFYSAIAIFNISISFWIGETALGSASSAILVAVLAFSLHASKRLKPSPHSPLCRHT